MVRIKVFEKCSSVQIIPEQLLQQLLSDDPTNSELSPVE